MSGVGVPPTAIFYAIMRRRKESREERKSSPWATPRDDNHRTPSLPSDYDETLSDDCCVYLPMSGEVSG